MSLSKVQVAVAVDTYVEAVQEGEEYEALTKLVEFLAIKFNVTIPAIRGTLVSAGVYVKATKEKVAGSTDDKDAIVKAMEIVSGLKLNSFNNASKKDLVAFWDYLVKSSDRKEVG